tara:strand:- start:49 stop:906 length:858 start_codon:yes stop_codon:yes gene_type:complete
MDYKEFIKKYGGDDKITKSDLRDFSALGGSQVDAQRFLEKAAEGKKGYEGTVGDKATSYASKDKNFSSPLETVTPAEIDNSPITNDYFSTAVGDTGNYFGTDSGSIPETVAAPSSDPQAFADQYIGSEEILYGFMDADREDRQAHETHINSINNAAGYNLQVLANAGGAAIEGIRAGAETYGYDTQYDIAMLGDARERDLVQYTTQVEDTRLRDFKDKDIAYGLNLQNIINSGLVAVAETQGMYSVSGIATRGRYDVETEQIRADANKDIAQTNMYANMMMAMGF